MAHQLHVSLGQHSDKGLKEHNQDFHGAYIPEGKALNNKGIAIALADGISSSDVSQDASEYAVKGFLDDYYCTSDAWSVKTSAQRVILAINSWLHSQTKQSPYRFDKDRGYVCTFSALVFKSNTAYLFHAGDTRIYRLRGGELEQLTEDHRIRISESQSYLNRALGVNPELEIDYHSLSLEVGDIFILATDGVYEFTNNTLLQQCIAEHNEDLNQAASIIIEKALGAGSGDNLTIQIVRIEKLPNQSADEVVQQLTEKPFPPDLKEGAVFDGFEVLRKVHISSRSHVYLALDLKSQQQVIIKIPSVDLRGDPAYLESFLMEEWVARRINNSHVLKPFTQSQPRNYFYIVTEYIKGQTLAQWMIDNPKPDMETVRDIVEQLARGLLAFHRLEMLHQDLKPENIMIDNKGRIIIIDFGSTHVAGIEEMASPIDRQHILGIPQYMAPEYFLGDGGTTRSDLFSLGVLTYQMLSGRLPYSMEVPKARTKAAQLKLAYTSVLDDEREIPMWVDEAIRKAVHPDPFKRYEELSSFVYNLRHPNQAFLNKTQAPLIEREPVLFWKSVSLMLALIIAALLLKS